MLCALDPRQPVIDRVGRDRRRERSEVVWRRAGDGRELAETPMRQSSGATRRFAKREIVVYRLGPELAGLDGALFELLASCASGLVERVDAGVSLVGWARRPFTMSGVRGDSGHTSAGHVVLLSNWPWGEWWERLLRRAARRGGQDGHSDDNGRLDLSNHRVNDNKCSVRISHRATRINECRHRLTDIDRSFRFLI